MSWRELLMVGFQEAKFPMSATVAKTLATADGSLA
jgi:hypothetical protein